MWTHAWAVGGIVLFALVEVSRPAAPPGSPTTQATKSPAPTTQPAELDLKARFGDYDGCFVLLDLKHDTLQRYNAARCAKRLSPCSTFKIPNSLIGLDTGVVKGADHIRKWDGVQRSREVFNHDHDLASGFRDSIVWYYQEVAQEIGAERMQRYLDGFGYGNRDISGGITQFWLNDSLLISADEQVAFLKRLATGDLPVAPRTLDTVRQIMVYEEADGVVLRGKTGTGSDGKNANLGWFVGYLTRPEGTYVFALNLEGGAKPVGFTARDLCLEILRDQGLLPPAPEKKAGT